MLHDSGKLTIQQFLDTGDVYYWFCKDAACKAEHGDIMEPLDMHRFRAKFGPDHGSLAPDILPLLHCTRCKRPHAATVRGAGQDA